MTGAVRVVTVCVSVAQCNGSMWASTPTKFIIPSAFNEGGVEPLPYEISATFLYHPTKKERRSAPF